MKKIYVILLILLPIIILNFNKNERIFYIPFEIPGKQMASTIPPFGVFIENKYKNEGGGKGTILEHELVHWNHQYKKMGLLKFYYNYLSEYIKHGRVNNHWMEVEARELSN